jgi:hypothetical protein
MLRRLIASVATATARVSASATATATATRSAAAASSATGSRWAVLAIAVAAIHGTVRFWLKWKLFYRLCAICAFQIQMFHVDHLSISKSHVFSFANSARPAQLVEPRLA